MSDNEFVVLMIYDICDDKRRTKMVKCLESFGTRVQKSAFEGMLTKKLYDKMMKKAHKLIDPKEDSFRVYVVEKLINAYSWGVNKRQDIDCIVI